MRVLHIGGFYPEIGGPYSLLKELVPAIKERGVDVLILSPLTKGYNTSRLKDPRTDDLEVGYIETDLLSSLWASYSNIWYRVVEEKYHSFDFIHVHGVFNHYAYVVSRYAKKPYIVSLHGSLLENAIGIKSKLRKLIYIKSIGNRILKHANFIHILNEYEKVEFERIYPNLYDNKLVSVPAGLNTSEFKNLPPKENFKNKFPELKGRRYVLFLGRINKIKGLDVLVEAFKEISKSYKDLYLVISGPDNEGYGEKIKDWLRYHGVINRTVFTETLNGRDKLEAFVDADLFVLSSYSDSFPLAVLEAMACGIPVVISNKVGIHREVMQNKAGIVVETNPESLLKGIKTLLDNKRLKEEIASNGKVLVESCYNINRVADMMIKVYQELADGRP